MFQTFNGANGIRINDPNLRAEQVRSQEWVLQQQLPNGMLRGSYFHEDKRDALISQTDVSLKHIVTCIQKLDKLRKQAVEVTWQLADVVLRRLDLQGSVTYAHSIILRDSKNPLLEGTVQPRIPDWRATLVGTWHVSTPGRPACPLRRTAAQRAAANTALGAYNDPNPNVYGAVSHYSVFDTKFVVRFDRQWSTSFGINNLGNFKYYVNPNPYPQRTLFASLKFDL
jgi:iron complex outermembrane receptor protein